MRILVTRRLPAAVEKALAAQFDVTLNADDRPLSPSEIARALADYDIVCPTITDTIDAALIEGVAEPRCRLIANFGAGMNHIDVAAAQTRGIALTNTPGALTEATADIALILILTAARRSGEGERELRAGQWTGWRPTHMLGIDLRGKTLGLFGFGRIAQALAERVRPLGMEVIYFRRSGEESPLGRRVGSLDELLAQSDVLSLHAPGGPETHHVIDRAALAKMKPDALLINTARGSLIDEGALVDALRTGGIRAAGLDVYEHEPAIHPGLLELENVVLVPHLGSATEETRQAMGMRMIENVAAFCAGQTPPDLLPG